ncbi:MAG TPA: PepSY-associated TM helix domain-containing protein [Methylocella sp.]|nr:PepSY-associated TM helix domain-containing protein [Methylocella sp.]
MLWPIPPAFLQQIAVNLTRDFARRRRIEAPLDLASLAGRAESLAPQARVESVLRTAPDQVRAEVTPRMDPESGKPFALGFDQLFLDPWTGNELGRRLNGDLSQGLINLMPFIYDLHWRLALGNSGFWILGIAAVLWTIDCFAGFYLTLPVAIANFWQRWKPAWLIKWRAGACRINLDLHRASGLWLWPMLFLFAWSSVMMDMRPVFDWVMQRLFDYRAPMEEFMSMAQEASDKPRLDWREAQAAGERLLAAEAARHGFKTGQPLGLGYIPDLGAYQYEVRGSRDVFERAPQGGSTAVIFDGSTGALMNLSLPTGERSGNTVESWLYALHMARVFGLPYQIFVCILGLVTAMLSVTGVYIWWKKRQARKISRARRGAAAEPQLMEPAE